MPIICGISAKRATVDGRRFTDVLPGTL